MKNAVVLFSLMICFTALAQSRGSNDRPPRKDHIEKPNFTPKQIADLKVKELTLLLDLSEKQQKQIQVLEFAAATERQTNFENLEKQENITDEIKFEKKSEMLDKQISMKNSMKEILTDEQFSKWEKSHKIRGLQQHHKKHHGKHREKKH